MRILIINGPNLNLTGTREPELYGKLSFDDILEELRRLEPGLRIDYVQSNVEGELIDRIQGADGIYDGVILNAGGYSHTSVAIGDAVAAVHVPVVEVHMSNIFSREPFRQHSHIAAQSMGSISGFAAGSYYLALLALKNKSENLFLRRKK